MDLICFLVVLTPDLCFALVLLQKRRKADTMEFQDLWDIPRIEDCFYISVHWS